MKNNMVTFKDELNNALKLAVATADGDSQMFALLLTAPLASWMLQGTIDYKTGTEAIRLLHELHPRIHI
jgi:hypothetical protein